MSSRPKYIIFLSTDGAGTHILRSLFMQLAEAGLADPIDHNAFLPTASACLSDPDGKKYKSGKTNKDLFYDLCRDLNLPVTPNGFDRETVYSLFEAAYAESKLVLDFSRPKYTTVRSDINWTQTDIDALRALVLGYIDRPKQKIELIFFQQVRNPLDHFASLYERFNSKHSIKHLKSIVETYLYNLDFYRIELDQRGYQKYMSTRLDDIVMDFNGFLNEFCKLTGVSIDLDYYTSRLSLNKWLSCPYTYKLLDDPAFMTTASKYGYIYPYLPLKLRWLFFLWGALQRNWLELKVIVDTATGKINRNNPINTKHQMKGMIPRCVNRILLILKLDCPSEHRRVFHDNLFKHNQK